MSARASKAVLGNDGDATLATGCLCCGSSDNVIGGEYAVIAHEFHGTVHYSMVATDQQLSQCNMLAPISVGQAGAAYTAAVQSTGVAADSVYWEAAPWSSRPHAAAIFSEYDTTTIRDCDNLRTTVSTRREGTPGPEEATGQWQGCAADSAVARHWSPHVTLGDSALQSGAANVPIASIKGGL